MIELKLIKDFPREIIAVDEVGRSPLSGPVVIGALRIVVQDYQALMTLLRSLRRNGVKDSKLLSPENRAALLKKFGVRDLLFRQKGQFIWKGIEITHITWEMDQNIIDTENIFQASMRGMKEAALEIQSGDRKLTTVLIDGQCKLRWNENVIPLWEEITIVKGDVKSSLVGLAAIIAKEKRDAFMREMHAIYPVYGFHTNAGYPTPFHRKSFSKVKEFIPTK